MARLTVSILCALWVSVLANSACANQPLMIDEVLSSSLMHFPEIAKAKAAREASEASVQAALGAYDASIDNETLTRAAGYYDGRYSTTKVTKPLQDLNARVSAGYRISEGSFPLYEDYFYTNNGGEFNLEVFLSLLRNRDIDDDRLTLWNSRLNVEKAKQEEILTKLNTQSTAMKAYYEWVAAGELRRIQEALLDLSQQRQKGLKTRAKHGDIAPLTETENLQYIYRRQGQVNDAKRLFNNAASNLSFYLRDTEGHMVTADVTRHPGIFSHAGSMEIDTKSIEKIYLARPEFNVIETDIEKEKNILKSGENKLLPKVDLVAKAAKDMGGGSPTRREAESIIGVNISIPLQTNAAEGTINKARATIRRLELDRQLLRDKIAQQLQYIENNYHAAQNNVGLSRQEVDIANKMTRAERQLFDQGGSDYFVLNAREEQFAQSKSKAVTAQLQLYQVLADYYAATVKLDKLMIQ